MRFSHGHMLRRKAGGFAFGILLVIVAALAAAAQSGSAVVRGTVTGVQGKAIAGAKFTLTSVDKNLSRSQTTNEEGIYVFNSIAPGSYRIDVEAASFKKTSISEVAAQVDTQRNVDIQLEVGSVTETTNITAAAEAPINFGSSVGGPVLRDRAFFFYSYEGRRAAAEQSILQIVPTGFSQQGDSNSNLVNFRFVYQPFIYQRPLNRETPVWNFTDDLISSPGWRVAV